MTPAVVGCLVTVQLVTVQLVDGGGRYALDWRTLAGVGAGVVALMLKRGFLVVFLVAITITALLRLLTS